MSNRPRRRGKRRHLTHAERWAADRYRPHRSMTVDEIRTVLVEDGVARRHTPLTWFVQAITFIALKEKRTRDAVYSEINEQVRERCGLPLPFADGVVA